LDLHPAQYPGATLRWPLADWSKHAELAFDISLDNGPPLDVIIKIEDAEHNKEHEDRFHRTLHISPGTHRFQIPLGDVIEAPRERQMDLRRIRRIQFFVIELGATRTLFLDNVHLK
jgi:hypothetical protein